MRNALFRRHRNLSSGLRFQGMEVTETRMTESAHDGLIIIASYLDQNAITWGKYQPWKIL
ncbi:uncharacterized protein Bfra_011019 [Botrytis fragariae]|uniref:Uncharacterized protein n=1 Tax=Botrytis fragariae TaxID=1964551 RepID=A0A8H6EEX1_9HELO|nr:uncharacterized protein Bfra_011019 [Botrytis fragariae]KAF5869819.1 hypothetical protein Bfra_011019 [Botrytis fragariae]